MFAGGLPSTERRSCLIGVARVALAARSPPGRRNKFSKLNLQGKVVSAPPGKECTFNVSFEGDD